MPVNIVVPEVGESIVDARIAKWLRQEGDAVAAGDPLVELETDKIDLEVSAPQAGVLSRIDHKDGEDVKVGDVLGVIDEAAAATGAKAPATEPPKQEPAPSPAGKQAAPKDAAAGATTGHQTQARSPRATPAARKVAEQNEVDLSTVRGSGDAGRVMRRDVEEAARGAASQPARPAGAPPLAPPPVPKAAPPVAEKPRVPQGDRTEERVRMSKRRATIARRLVEAQSTAAMLTTFNEVDMSAVNAFRAKHKERIEKETGIRLSALPFFVKAATAALAKYPIVNALLDGDAFVYRHYVNMGIAVSSEAGLVVPNLKDVHAMSLLDIARAISAVAKKARDGKLTMDDLTGGTFTITNGGVFGSLMSTPILNHPQVGILGLHNVLDRPVALNGQVMIRPMMYIALSYDHRVVDGEQAVRFLVHVKEMIEDPAALLLG